MLASIGFPAHKQLVFSWDLQGRAEPWSLGKCRAVTRVLHRCADLRDFMHSRKRSPHIMHAESSNKLTGRRAEPWHAAGTSVEPSAVDAMCSDGPCEHRMRLRSSRLGTLS